MNTLSLMDRSEVALADVIAINDSVVGSIQRMVNEIVNGIVHQIHGI